MRNARGFTLLDLVLVCGIIASAGTAAFSWLSGVIGQQRLHLAADSFISAANSARYQAVTGNFATEIRIHPDWMQFAITPKGRGVHLWQTLPKGVSFVRLPGRSPTFHSRGFATPAGSFVLANEYGSVQIIISVSGRIRWQRIS